MSSNRFERPDPVDPELRELLREIAARQESHLLRPRSARNVRELLGEGEWMRAGATGLSSAERHLLTRYREEAAFLLRELARERLLASSRFRRMYCDRSGTTISGSAGRERSLRLRLEEELSTFSGWGTGAEGCLELRATVRLAQKAPASASTYARASLQLAPSAEARLCIASDLMNRGSHAAALATYSRISLLAPFPSHRACAQAGCGIALAKLDDFDAALGAHRRAVSADPSEPGHSWNWLCYAVQAGDEPETRAAISFIERELQPAEADVVQWVSNAVAQRARGEWSNTPLAAPCARSVTGAAGTVSGRILDVFL